MRWFLLLALLCACARTPEAPAHDPLYGTWDGGDWGSVGIRENLTGTYAGTFEGSTGDIWLTRQGEGLYKGTWSERVASEGQPLRKGDLTVRLQGDSAEIQWEATDNNPKRQASGTSTWKRTTSPG